MTMTPGRPASLDHSAERMLSDLPLGIFADVKLRTRTRILLPQKHVNKVADTNIVFRVLFDISLKSTMCPDLVSSLNIFSDAETDNCSQNHSFKVFFYLFGSNFCLRVEWQWIEANNTYINPLSPIVINEKSNEVTIHTLPHLKCIRLVSVRSSLPCINIDDRLELTKI